MACMFCPLKYAGQYHACLLSHPARHTHTHTHARTHIHTHTQSHTHTHTLKHTGSWSCPHGSVVQPLQHTHSISHTHSHTLTHTPANKQTQADLLEAIDQMGAGVRVSVTRQWEGRDAWLEVKGEWEKCEEARKAAMLAVYQVCVKPHKCATACAHAGCICVCVRVCDNRVLPARSRLCRIDHERCSAARTVAPLLPTHTCCM